MSEQMQTRKPPIGGLMNATATVKKLPNRPDPSVLWRWRTIGLPGPNGERIRLKSYKFGRKYYYRLEDVLDFGARAADAATRAKLEAKAA